MAIKLNTGFNIRSNVPIDERFILTFKQMTLINDKLMPENYFAVSSDDGKLYIYSKSNDFDTKTGKFRLAFENIDAKLDELIAQSTTAIDQVKAETELKISTLSTRVTTVEDKIAKIQLGDIEVGQTIELVTDADYRVTANLKNNSGEVISSSTIDLPIESLIKSVTYDRAEKKLVLRSENGIEIARIALDDLVANLATSTELAEVENKIPLRISDLPNDADYITRVESNTNLNNALKNYRSASAQDAIDATLQRKLTAGANIKISKDGVISAAAMAAPENTYYAGDGITISETNVVSATLTEQIVDEKIDSATTEMTTYVDSSVADVNSQVDSKITEVSTKVDSAVTEMTSYVDTTVEETVTNINEIVNESLESCAKLNDVYLDEEIVIPYDEIDEYEDQDPVNTPVMQIIKDLFAPAPIPTGLKFYYGLSKEIPTSIENLSEVIVDKNTLQTNGFEVDLSPSDDYQIFAIDKELGLRIKSIKVAGFETEFTTIILDGQYLYYIDRADDSFTYEIVFKEA